MYGSGPALMECPLVTSKQHTLRRASKRDHPVRRRRSHVDSGKSDRNRPGPAFVASGKLHILKYFIYNSIYLDPPVGVSNGLPHTTYK